MEIILTFAGIIGGWFFTHIYYKKSLNDQRGAWEKMEERLLSKVEPNPNLQKSVTYELRMKAALTEYKRKGTPKHIIDTFDDYTKEQKAKFYDDALLRAKGRIGKNNPYL